MLQNPTQTWESDDDSTQETTKLLITAPDKTEAPETLVTVKEMRTQMTKMDVAEEVDPYTAEAQCQEYTENDFLPQATQFEDVKAIGKRGNGKLRGNKVLEMGSLVDDADEEGDSYSEDIMVLQNEEDQSYLNKVVIGKLSRLGMRNTLWTTKSESFFVIFSFLLTYHSLASFVVEFEKYGAIFILPYITVVFFVALPVMYIETALGQYTSSTVCVVFDRMAPVLLGLGFTKLVYNFLTIVADETILTYFMLGFFHSTQLLWDQLGYNHCSNSVNNIECRAMAHPTCEDLNQKLAKDSLLDQRHWKDIGLRYVAYGDLCIQSRMPQVYQKETDPLQIEKQDVTEWMGALAKNQYMHWDIDMNTSQYLYLPSLNQMWTLCLSWFVVYLICSNSQKVVVRTQKITIHLALSAFLTLPLAVLIFKPPEYPFMKSFSFNNGLDLETWVRATVLVIRMFKLGQGGYVYLGAQHDIHNPILPDCLIIAIVLTVIPVLYTIVHLLLTDSFLLGLVKGDVVKWVQASENAHRKKFRSTDSQIYQFTLFSMSVSSLGSYESFIMSIVSFCGMMMVLCNKIAHVEMIVSSIREYAFEPEDHKLILSTVAIAACLCSFLFKGTFGFFNLLSFDNFLLPTMGITILVCEVIALIIYNPIRLYANLMFLCNRRNLKDKRLRQKQYFNTIIVILFLFGIPAMALFQIIGVMIDREMLLSDYSNPNTVVIFMYLAGIILAVPVTKMSNQYFKVGDFHGLFSPNRDLWGPRSSVDRDVADLVERETRLGGFGDNKKKAK